MQVHYYKTTWGRAWQQHNQKKYGYNPKYKEVKPQNKPSKIKTKKTKKRTNKLLTLEILKQRRINWENSRKEII